jgi:hypothetical protein
MPGPVAGHPVPGLGLFFPLIFALPFLPMPFPDTCSWKKYPSPLARVFLYYSWRNGIHIF